jgi:hypothetical protein
MKNFENFKNCLLNLPKFLDFTAVAPYASRQHGKIIFEYKTTYISKFKKLV